MAKYIGAGAAFYTLIYGVWLAYAHKYNIDGMAGLGGDDQTWYWTRLLFPIFCPILGGLAGAVTYAVAHFAAEKSSIGGGTDQSNRFPGDFFSGDRRVSAGR